MTRPSHAAVLTSVACLSALLLAPMAITQPAKTAAKPATKPPVKAAAKPAAAKPAPKPIDPDTWVASTLKSMTIVEKLGQMIMPQAEGAFTNFTSEYFLRLKSRVNDLHAGGFIVYRGTPHDTAAMINELQRTSKVPLLIAGDLERGAASQFPGMAVSIPSNLGIGATGKPAYAAFGGSLTAKEGRAVGYHMTFAPVADVNNNPDNPIINVRSFGEDPAMVSKMTEAYIRGAKAAGLLTTAKHFPGHGDTATDSHIDLGIVTGDRERLDRVELAPFRTAIKGGVDAIMTAHLAVPAIEADLAVPATMSKSVLTGLLREQLGFQGLIVTDALDMGGVTKRYWPGEVVIRSVEAGADILLMPPDPFLALRVLQSAVKGGRLTEARINQSVERILRAKARLGLHQNRLVDLEKIGGTFGDPALQNTAEDIAKESITLLRDTRQTLPVSKIKRQRALVVVVNADTAPAGEHFLWQVKQRIEESDVDVVQAGPEMTAAQASTALDKAARADVILAPVYVKISANKGTAGLPLSQIELLLRLVALNKPMMVVSFSNPYLLRDLPNLPGYMCAYSISDVSERAAVRAIFGENAISGKLPVTIPALRKGAEPLAPLGSGINAPALPMTIDRSLDGQDTRFQKAFGIIERAIAGKGFPGAVLAVGRQNKLVALKAFGKMDYSPDAKPVPVDAIWDMASCSKVVTTTTLAAILIESKWLLPEMPVRAYLPEFGSKDPNDLRNTITIKQLLMHSSGLQGVVPYYKTAKDRAELMQMMYATPLVNPPGTKMVYSDAGIILLGEIIERLTGFPLDSVAAANIFMPLGMRDTGYNLSKSLLPRIAPTEYDKDFRHRQIHGEVHDENAWVLGGVAGHAGLFATAESLAKFSQMMLNGGIYAHKRILKRSTVEMITTRQNEPVGTSRAIGWDTPTPEGQSSGARSSAGHYLSASAFGHTGFTGTSIWIDPEKELFVILLTNRVNPTREKNMMVQVRPEVADAVVEALGMKPQINADEHR